MENVIEICKRVVPGLGNMREAIVTLLPSGSNKVYLVESLVPNGLGKAIYREFGAKEIVNVQYERVIAKRLGDLGIGPKTYEQTDTYRVEEFLPGRTLERTEVRSPTLIPLICTSFHQFHSLDMSSVMPVIPTAIRNAQIWREKCVSSLPSSSIDIGDLLSEELYARFLSLVPATASLFFCHQDCYCLNYLYTPSSETLRLLDYEYAGYCYRGMDFASLLNGLLYDYQSPDPPYLTYHPADRCTDELLTQYISAYGGDEELWTEARLCFACDHYVWAIWSVAMAGQGRPGFDYVAYARLRMRDFQHEAESIERLGGPAGLKSLAAALLSKASLQ